MVLPYNDQNFKLILICDYSERHKWFLFIVGYLYCNTFIDVYAALLFDIMLLFKKKGFDGSFL